MKNLNNKVAAVTGAASGIGRALAINLAQEGCHLALSDIDETGLRQTKEQLLKHASGKNISVTTHIVDVANRDNVYQYAEDAIKEHGHVDIVINNAGVAANKTIDEIDYDDFEWVININMWGVIYGTKAFLPHLKQRPDAHIVNIASVNSMLGFPSNGPYNVTKYAVQGFTETLIQENMGTNLHVSSVHPGGIQTNIANSARHIATKNAQQFNKIANTTPDKAAKTIIKGMKKNKEKIFVGIDAHIMQGIKRLFPNGAVRLSGYLTNRTMNP